MKRFLIYLASVTVIAALPSLVRAEDFRERYERWTRQTDPQGNVYFQCKYHFATLNGDAVHYVTWRPADAQKRNYYFWTSDGLNYWGKCLAPGAPGFNPEKMQWYCYQRLGDVTITLALTPGSCPAPADANPDDWIVAVPPWLEPNQVCQPRTRAIAHSYTC